MICAVDFKHSVLPIIKTVKYILEQVFIMSEPTLTFIYNHSDVDAPYSGDGGPYGNWKEIFISNTELPSDIKVYTGGGIHQSLTVPTEVYGRREATIRPATGIYPVPQIYIESSLDDIMYHVPLASGQPNVNRYIFGVYISGQMVSDLYLEMWDDDTFSTTNIPTLSGTIDYPHSIFNAIRTTDSNPPSNWSGDSGDAAYLAGYENRLGLKGGDFIQNEALYFSVYAAIPYDLEFTHDTPIEGYRYLYT